MLRIQIGKEVKSISDFLEHSTSLLEEIRRTKRPFVITQNGKSTAILMDIREYENLLEKLDVLTDISAGEVDIQKKRCYSSGSALDMVRKKIWK